MRAEILDHLDPDTSEPRNKPLSIPVTASQLAFYRKTCEMVEKKKGKNTVPKVAGMYLMDLCKEIRKRMGDEGSLA